VKISLIITAIILIIQIIIRPDSVYISDPLVKAIQVKSLFLNGWNSQDIFYPAKEYDPLFTMNPLNEGFIFFNKGRFIGQYPVALSFFYSIILFLGFSLLPYLNSLILFPMVFLYSKNLYNKNIHLDKEVLKSLSIKQDNGDLMISPLENILRAGLNYEL
jgi:hypothetical protein